MTGRLSTLQAALVIARRDFFAVLFSRNFLFFLIMPLFTIGVGGAAGTIGGAIRSETDRPVVGIVMTQADTARMLTARERLEPYLTSLPEFTTVQLLQPGEKVDPGALLTSKRTDLGGIVSGSPEAPVLTGTIHRTRAWSGQVALVAAQASDPQGRTYPEVRLADVATSGADQRSNRMLTAQAGLMLLFLLTMLLAGMVVSNLVEEKSNKIIEVLAAAIPMDSVFFGKLFAMLGVSLVGIATWSGVVGVFALAGGDVGRNLVAPAVGWPLFAVLFVTYFSMAYLLLGSIFLAIGGMATTVRDVQTLSMPVTMMQLLVFFFAMFAMAQPGSMIELAAIALPFTSPFAMLARGAQDGAIWPHVAAIGWQVLWVIVFVRAGAAMFRKRVMKSGPSTGRTARKGLFFRRKPSGAGPATA
jgi:ABC-2 type transport system permease protein